MTKTELRAENERKKEYLRSYQRHVKRVHQITDEIRELRARKMSASAKTGDGMPNGSGGHGDLSDYIVQLDSKIDKLIDEREQCIIAYRRIVRQVKRLKSRQESHVLFYRYIHGYSWDDVAQKIGCKRSRTFEVHGDALLHFKIPESLDTGLQKF